MLSMSQDVCKMLIECQYISKMHNTEPHTFISKLITESQHTDKILTESQHIGQILIESQHMSKILIESQLYVHLIS